MLTTYWQRPPQVTLKETEDLNLFSHLLFNGQQLQENGELGRSYPLSLWEPDRADDRRLFVMEELTATGKVYFETGLYQLSQDEIHRIDILDGNGNVAADQVNLWQGT